MANAANVNEPAKREGALFMKILCICNQGENRSKTTALLLKQNKKHEARYDGFYKERYHEKDKRWEKFDPANLDWAERIIVFEDIHEDELKKIDYTYWGKSVNFDIPDKYYFNQPELIKIINEKIDLFDLL